MAESNNKKLAVNLGLMFLVFFLPKVFSFFLVPLYTSFLTTEEYGISDLIINTASLIIPFLALGSANAVLRFTIENKEDKRPIQISIRILAAGGLLLAIALTIVYYAAEIKASYLLFVFLISVSSVLSDIGMSYARGEEQMKLITFCGVGSSLLSILCNILLIAVFRLGLYGFLVSSVAAYLFNIIVVGLYYSKHALFAGILSIKEPQLQKEMLQYSVPLILSGLAWWVISSSDRYFVSWLCGAAANGIYSVAYKIPTILQTAQSVFNQAWVFTLYDSYKTEEGLRYISRVYSFYSFLITAGCAFLITLDIPLSRLLYAKDFFLAWRYVPVLLLSIVFTSLGAFMGGFMSVYKETKFSAKISVFSAALNIVLNYILIILMDDAMGAAVATAITFFVYYALNVYKGIKLSGVKINLKKQAVEFVILICQCIAIVAWGSLLISGVLLLLLLSINIGNIKMALEKLPEIFGRFAFNKHK